MANIYMYAHGGSGNHGCEAIVRSTASILSEHNLTLISAQPQEDYKYHIDDLCAVLLDRDISLNKQSFDFLKAYIALKAGHNFIPMDKLWYKTAFSHVKQGDIALSIGGDNYCYADSKKYIMFHDMMKARKAKTVLWGCSVEPDVAAQPDKARDLARYDLIVARESITYEALRKVQQNIILAPDPAFFMAPRSCRVDDRLLSGNVIGINISPMIISSEKAAGMAYENYKQLIAYLLKNTDLDVALIPHVVWASNDDRTVLRRLYDDFGQNPRLILVEDHSAPELKYIISKCRMFIGARTHATIAAYSSCVPTLVVGYSVKARGIARDLFGTEENYVLPVQQLSRPEQLTEAFQYLLKNETDIRRQLTATLPGYLSKMNQAAAAVHHLSEHSHSQ